MPRPPDSGPGRSGLGTGRASTLPAVTPAPRSATPPPIPSPPTPIQTRPRVAIPVDKSHADTADTTGADTVPGGMPPVRSLAANPQVRPPTEETTTRSGVPTKITDTQPGTGPIQLPAQRSDTAPEPEQETDDPFAGSSHESDPDIFAGLFDESPDENALVATPMARSDGRPRVDAQAADHR